MENPPSFSQIVLKIIEEQKSVMGPLAWYEAGKVLGLQINEERKEISFQEGDPKEIIDKLVNQYEKIFGKASHEVCRDAVRDFIVDMPTDKVPESLK